MDIILKCDLPLADRFAARSKGLWSQKKEKERCRDMTLEIED